MAQDQTTKPNGKPAGSSRKRMTKTCHCHAVEQEYLLPKIDRLGADSYHAMFKVHCQFKTEGLHRNKENGFEPSMLLKCRKCKRGVMCVYKDKALEKVKAELESKMHQMISMN